MARESAKEASTMRDILKEIRERSIVRDNKREFQLGNKHHCCDSNGKNNGTMTIVVIVI